MASNYIDGAWVDGGAGRIDVTDPATGATLAEHALADAADVDRAVRPPALPPFRRADRHAPDRTRGGWCRRWGGTCWSTRTPSPVN
jgi:acyl-CoA reductase-like NAD-dependent aldehyde dehydrogenase